jgi:L-amino acid N-acyltransferase YncA
MNYSIIKAEEKHLEAILEIYNYYINNSTATYYTHELSLAEMHKKIFFENERFQSFVIQNENDEVIGFCSLCQYNTKDGYDRTAEISMYIHADYTGKGIGSHAMEFLEKKAREYGFHILIGAATSKNTASIKMFEKAGYSKCAHYKEIGFKFGEVLDDVHYQKILK